MAYYRSYGMGPNAQYGYESAFRQGVPNGGTGGDYMSMASDTNQFGMGVQSPYSPPNNGGPGNPGTANNMPKPMLPRFNPGFQNNKGPAPLTPNDVGYNGSGINPQPYGFGQGGAPTMGTYSPSVQMNQSQAPLAQHLSGLSPVQTGGSAQFNRGYSGDTMQGRQDAWQNQQQAPRQDNYYRRPNMGGDPFNQYGYAGQSPQLGRYIPPMMTNPGDVNAWNNQGGYAYNIPNSYGSGQWNQFNSRDVAFPQFGQSQNVPTPRLNPGTPPPSYQSPFGRPDPMRQQNYLAYMMNLAQGGQAQSNSTQPGAPDQPPPVV
mgnify:FL=1